MGRSPVTYLRPVKLRRPPLLDALIALAFVAMNFAEALFNPDVTNPVEHVGIAGLALATLAWRRQFPLVVAALVAGSNLVTDPNGEFTTLLSLVLVCFTVGSETGPPRAWWGLALVFVPFMVVSVAHGFVPSDLAAGMVFFIGPWTVGQVLRSAPPRSEAAVERAAQLERQAELEAARAAAEERTRIARELHDIVSHSISVVTIQTQAVRRRLGPDHAARGRRPRRRRGDGARGTGGDAAAVRGAAHRGTSPLDLAPQPGLVRARPAGARRSAPATCEVRLPSRATRSISARASTWRRTASPRRASPTRCGTPGASRADVHVRYAPDAARREVQDNGRGLASSNGHPPATAVTAWSASASGSRCTAAPSTSSPARPAAYASPRACR